MPAPSSETVMITSPAECFADSFTVPFSGLPSAMRTFISSSMPWSIQFLTRCIRGSLRLSTMLLSTSVVSPSRTSSASLFSFIFISRTILPIFWNTPASGTILIDITVSWSSSVSFLSCLAAFEKLSSSRPSRSGFAITIDSVVMISPTISCSVSSFDRFTLIRLCFWPPLAFLMSSWAFVTALFAAGFAGAGWACGFSSAFAGAATGAASWTGAGAGFSSAGAAYCSQFK